MESPESPLVPRVGVVDLAHRLWKSGILEHIQAEQPREGSSVVLKDPPLDDLQSRQATVSDIEPRRSHGRPRVVGAIRNGSGFASK